MRLPLKFTVFSLALVLEVTICAGQARTDWTRAERKEYATLTRLFDYLHDHPFDPSSQASHIRNFIDFDYVLLDTLKNDITRRLTLLDTLTRQFQSVLDKIGMLNLDVRPARFYLNDSAVYHPFLAGLNNVVDLCLILFDTRRPKDPAAYLLFDKKTFRLVSWVLINQGGYYYFLTPDQL